MPVRCYELDWYKYQIRIGARVLICKDLCDRVMDGGGWSDSHTRWTKSPPVNNTGEPIHGTK